MLTSAAGHDAQPGGGGCVAADHADQTVATTLRLDLLGEAIG